MVEEKNNADRLIEEAETRPDRLEIHRLRTENTALKRAQRELLDRLHNIEARADLWGELEAYGPPKPIKRYEKTSRLKEATAFLLCSDWHVGETVNNAMVNERNQYNPKVARNRVSKLAEGVEWLINMHRGGEHEDKFMIRDVVVALLGDMITGWLHQDQRTTNSLMPTPEVLETFDLIAGLLDHILENVQPERLIVTGNYGNHGRMTMKTLHNAQAETSFEWLIYQFLARRYQDDPRVSFNLCAGKLLYLPVYDFMVRMSHGDDIGYGGGIGGVTIPINKAIRAWNTMKHADIDVMGHWHQYVCLPNLVINSSLIGYSPYSIKIKAPYEPPTQAFFLVEPGRGKRADNRIWVEKR